MNLQPIVQTNKKGQIVIPKKIREKLGIIEGTLLQIVPRDTGIYIHPMKISPHSTHSNESFLKLLKSTAGAWGPATPEDIKREKEQRRLELEASKRGKKAW
jgi:AbrB family looped-hinge helix DNA binding protein